MSAANIRSTSSAVKHDNEINPNVGPDYRFREGDHIILIGRSNEVFKLAAKM